MQDTYNRLPSGIMAQPSSPSSNSADSTLPDSSQPSSLPLILSIIALLLGASALYLELSKPQATSISQQDREAILSIAKSLRAMQQKEFITSSPVIRTNVLVEKTFPLSDIMPANITIPVSADIPIQTTVSAISQSGQVMTFRINDTLRLRTSIPIDISKSGDNLMVRINQEVPVNTRISGSFRFSDVFPSEFNTIIQQLEAIAEEKGQQ